MESRHGSLREERIRNIAHTKDVKRLDELDRVKGAVVGTVIGGRKIVDVFMDSRRSYFDGRTSWKNKIRCITQCCNCGKISYPLYEDVIRGNHCRCVADKGCDGAKYYDLIGQTINGLVVDEIYHEAITFTHAKYWGRCHCATCGKHYSRSAKALLIGDVVPCQDHAN